MEDTCKHCQRSLGALYFSDERGKMKACPGCSGRSDQHIFYLEKDFRPRSKSDPTKLSSYCKGCQIGGINRNDKHQGVRSVTPVAVDCKLATGMARTRRNKNAVEIVKAPTPVAKPVVKKHGAVVTQCITLAKSIKKLIQDLSRDEIEVFAPHFQQLGDTLTDQYTV